MNADREAIAPNDVEFFVLTCNRANMLRQQLQSLVDQTVSPAKITVIDNGSTDDTASVVKEFGDKYKTVHYYPTGTHFASNVYTFKTTQKLASSKYVGVFHDDDIVNPLFLEFALHALNTYDDVVMVSADQEPVFNASAENMPNCGFDHHVWRGDDAVLKQLLFSRLTFPCTIYRTADYKVVQYNSDVYGKMFDVPFLFEMSTRGAVVFFDSPLLRYRLHKGSDSNNGTNRVSEEMIRNVLLRTREFLPNTLVSKIIKAYMLVEFLGTLLVWAHIVALQDKNELLEIALKYGIITKCEYKALKMRFTFKLIKKLVKKMKRRVKREVVRNRYI